MKARNLNSSSRRTRKKIRKVFAEMLSEKIEYDKISVSELCKRAEISRGTFYSHYDDIYGVAEDYEYELIARFYDDVKLRGLTDFEKTLDSFFEFIKENEEDYRKLCYSDKNLRDKNFLAGEIRMFVEGMTFEFVRYCRGYSDVGTDELYLYTKDWLKRFLERRMQKTDKPQF